MTIEIHWSDITEYMKLLEIEDQLYGEDTLESLMEEVRDDRINGELEEHETNCSSDVALASTIGWKAELEMWKFVLWTNFCASWHMLSWAAIVGRP